MTTTYTQQQIFDMAIEEVKNFQHNGLNFTIDHDTLGTFLNLKELAEAFNEDEEDAMYDLSEEVAEMIRRFGEITTELQAEVEIDGEKYLMTWIPANVSNAYLENQWAIAFADENNPPHDGQIHQETGHRQITTQMTRVDTLEELHESFYHLQPLNND